MKLHTIHAGKMVLCTVILILMAISRMTLIILTFRTKLSLMTVTRTELFRVATIMKLGKSFVLLNVIMISVILPNAVAPSELL